MGATQVNSDTGGDGDAQERMAVHICEADTTDNKQRQMAADGLKQVLDSLVDGNFIPGWYTSQWETSFNLDCDGKDQGSNP